MLCDGPGDRTGAPPQLESKLSALFIIVSSMQEPLFELMTWQQSEQISIKDQSEQHTQNNWW